MAVKNIVSISLTIFITTIIVIFGTGISQNNSSTLFANSIQNNVVKNNINGDEDNSQNDGGKRKGNVNSITLPAPSNNQANNNSNSGITASQVAQHNNYNDCWMTVGGKVYNVTNFLLIHSGGASQIIPFCGKDATVAFNTKSGQGSHRQGDLSILNNYYVGNLK